MSFSIKLYWYLLYTVQSHTDLSNETGFFLWKGIEESGYTGTPYDSFEIIHQENTQRDLLSMYQLTEENSIKIWIWITNIHWPGACLRSYLFLLALVKHTVFN